VSDSDAATGSRHRHRNVQNRLLLHSAGSLLMMQWTAPTTDI